MAAFVPAAAGAGFPWLPAGILVSQFLSGLFGGSAKKKQAEAARRAENLSLASRRLGHEASERQRAAKLDRVSGLLGSVQGSLGKGSPNYTIDPATLERFKAPRPFTDTPGPDPRAGLGSSFLSGLFGGIGNALTTTALGKSSQAGGGGVATGLDSASKDALCRSISVTNPMMAAVLCGGSTSSPSFSTGGSPEGV